MGLFRKIHASHSVPRPHAKHGKKLQGAGSRSRICRFEQMEPRQLLSATVAPLHVATTYFEDSNDFDQSSALHGTTTQVADLFQVSFAGGADGTQLTQLRINTDNTFFDTAAGGIGAYGSFPLTIISHDGFEITSSSVVDGGTQLLLAFSGFKAGDKLVFSIDVDEQGNLQPNAVAEGAEFEGATMTTAFTAPNMNDITTPAITFYDAFSLTGTGLENVLPNDDYDNAAAKSYVPEICSPGPVYTAGASGSVQQIPLPISLSGFVYVDANNNGVFDQGETPISGAQLTLLDDKGDSTGLTATTDDSGFYLFDSLAPGTYAVAEAQPAGYYDGLDAAGSAGGTAHNPPPGDLIDGITLVGGTAAKHYDFGELLPASIRGQVYADLNDNNTLDPGEPLLSDVTIYLLDGSGSRITSTTTDANGKYAFTDLKPGMYGTEEIQPAAYLEGSNAVGTAGGTLDGPDRILNAQLDSGVNGLNYDFWEVVPAKISGYVFQDGPAIVVKEGDPMPDIPSLRDGKLTPDDVRLSAVVLELCDGSGVPLLDSHGNKTTTVTDVNGYYEFNMLYPGEYSIVEIPPSQYLAGIDRAGSNGGLVVNPYSQVATSMLSSLAVNANGNAIVRIPVNPGDVAVQYNFSHVLVTSKPTPPNNPPGPPSPPTPPTPPLAPPMPIPFVDYQPMGHPYFMLPDSMAPPFAGGSGGPAGCTWHLSVIDAGHPRGDPSDNDFVQSPENSYFDPVSWTGPDLTQSQWILANQDGVPIRTIRFGMTGATPVVGDWDGSGTTKVGVFLDGLWFLDLNGNGTWDESDLWIKLGKKADQPVAGDWNGDGKTDIGIFGPAWIGDLKAVALDPGLPDSLNPPKNRPKNVPPKPADAAVGWRTLKCGAAGKLRSDLIDHVFQFGTKGDLAVVGDWNGDGIYTIGIFRDGVWFLDIDGDGRWSEGDVVVEYGRPGDLPVVGDWTGDGISKLGVYRNGTFYLDTNNNHVLDAADKVIELGRPGDKPVAGDWNGDGVDSVGVYEDGAASEPQT